jgi:molybdopterin-guanine dinucleotide biosynthesis protein B
MKIIAIVGRSNTGKTRLIKKLIKEWKRLGRSVSVIKHCSRGFSLDVKGKDSWEFMRVGAAGVSMLAPDKMAVIQRKGPESDFVKIAQTFFPDSDFVIIEGGKEAKNVRKIEVLREGKSEVVRSRESELLAVVSSRKIGTKVPEFLPGQIEELVDFLEKHL